MPLCSEHFFGKTYPLSGLTKLLPFSHPTREEKRKTERKKERKKEETFLS